MVKFSTLVLLFFPFFLASQNAAFPEDYLGVWKGELQVFNHQGLAQELPMQLHILPLDSNRYSFTIIYGTDTLAGKRAYELVQLDKDLGLYLVDEKNTIQMEAYYIAGKLWQNFEVQGSLLNTVLWLDDDVLFWELSFGSSTPVRVSGGQMHQGEEIPPVKAFPVNGIQRARLKKM